MMDKCFWENMAAVWCQSAESIDVDAIKGIADRHAAQDLRTNVGYSRNPLDDEDEEDDFDDE